ncbi:MAG TPA: long-chain fatty acid--CoA ligase [Sedimenticola sp.]|nr:long-chain fatty acid--CoA ligase [Sedimenticola sp.]
MHKSTDIIPLKQAPTLAAAFRERVRRSAGRTACVQFDAASQDWVETSWGEMGRQVARWQAALLQEDLNPGDRVALMVRNCKEWMIFDQAALGLGLVVVPIYTNDRPANIGYILRDAGVRLFLFENDDQWQELQQIGEQLAGLHRVIALKPLKAAPPYVVSAADWLPEKGGELTVRETQPDELATIVYTSGTTGQPKGVMLSHHNILWNVHAALKVYRVYPEDRFLSFLPLSHTFERTIGYYLPMVAGSSIAYARSIPQLAQDLSTIRPTLMISVPRIFERIYGKIMAKLETDPPIVRELFNLAASIGWRRFEYRQKRASWSPALLLWPLLDRLVARKIRARMGGRLRFTVSGGAALSPEIARLFIGLGIPVQQGYGLTETSPVIAGNTLDDNIPASVGAPLPGIEVKIGDNDELLTRSPSVMLGYWNNEQATREVIDDDGWLHTGDKARIEHGHIFITGRLKEIIVLANGEKVSPGDMEMAIALDGLFEQVMVLGEGKPYLAALVVLETAQYRLLVESLNLSPDDEATLRNKSLHQALLKRIQNQLGCFPGYAQIRRLAVTPEPWTVDNGLITPTLKLKRNCILDAYGPLVEELYRGH